MHDKQYKYISKTSSAGVYKEFYINDYKAEKTRLKKYYR